MGLWSSWVPALPRAGQRSGLSQALQVVLGVGPKALIDVALQMDGQVRNAEDGPLHTYQALLQAPRGWVLKHKEDSWGQACRAERLQQVPLCVGRHTEIHSYRTVHALNQTHLYDHPPGHSEVAVKPGVPDASSIGLHANLHYAHLSPLRATLHLGNSRGVTAGTMKCWGPGSWWEPSSTCPEPHG